MVRMPTEKIDISDPAIAQRVLEVQRAAYAVEAGLIGSTEIPPLQESLAELQSAPLHWLASRSGDRIVAAIAWTDDGELIDIDRLMVDPAAMRQGHASALVLALDLSKPVTVSTGSRNAPADALYRRLGFVPVGKSEPVPGLPVRHYVRRPDEP